MHNCPANILGALLSSSLLCCFPSLSIANVLIDTGPGDTRTAPAQGLVNSATGFQFLAGKFTLEAATRIDAVSGWMYSTSAGQMQAALYSNVFDRFVRRDLPDTKLGETRILSVSRNTTPGWISFSTSGWELEAGTYWLAFEPLLGFSGAMPGSAPNPLTGYAYRTFGPYYSGMLDQPLNHFGLKIEGLAAPIPEPSTQLLLLGGLLAIAKIRDIWRMRQDTGLLLH